MIPKSEFWASEILRKVYILLGKFHWHRLLIEYSNDAAALFAKKPLLRFIVLLVSSKTSRNFVARSPSSQLIINLLKLRSHSHTQGFIWCFSGPKNRFASSVWWSTEIRSFAYDCSFYLHPVKYRKSKSLYNFRWFIATMHAIYVRVCWNSLATTRVEEDRGAGARENRGRSPREQGAGEGGKRENRGWEAVSTRGRAAGAEINKAIVYCLLLGIIQSKALI